MKTQIVLIAAAVLLSSCENPAPRVQCAGTSKVHLGMTRDELIKACGKPVSINREQDSSGISEQWAYATGADGRDYAYVKDGVVDYFQW